MHTKTHKLTYVCMYFMYTNKICELWLKILQEYKYMFICSIYVRCIAKAGTKSYFWITFLFARLATQSVAHIYQKAYKQLNFLYIYTKIQSNIAIAAYVASLCSPGGNKKSICIYWISTGTHTQTRFRQINIYICICINIIILNITYFNALLILTYV